MRKITIFTVIFCFTSKFSPLFILVHAFTYDRCELLSEFIVKHKLPLQDSIGMTCIANFISELKTTHAQTDIRTNRRIFGMFGISEGTACKFESPGLCKVTCDKFLDNDISDDLECIQKIFDKTTKKSKVFRDCESFEWKHFMEECPEVIKHIDKREAMKSKIFKLKDFESIDIGEERRTIMRPGPPANPLPVSLDYDEDDDAFRKSNKEPDYVTNEPPRPFQTRPKNRRKSNKRNGNRKNSNKRVKKQKAQIPRINLNLMSSVIKTPIIPMDFHVIPGPSVSVPISSLGQPIPDVPIEPPPTLNSALGLKIPAFQSREYLPPFASQLSPDGLSKKYDIKLDRPASRITVHVTYA